MMQRLSFSGLFQGPHLTTSPNSRTHPLQFSGDRKPPSQQADSKIKQTHDLLGWLVNNAYVPNTPLQDVEFTVFDLETSGLKRSSLETEVIELTAIKYKNGVETGKFSTLVKPEHAIPEEIQELTHITAEMAAEGMEQKQALEAFAEFVGPYPTLVAHNASYDVPFLRSKLHQNGLDQWMDRFQLNDTLCTQTLARVALPELEGYPEKGKGMYTLDTVSKHLGISNPGAHRAENDVKTTALTLFSLIKRLQEKPDVTGNPMETLRDLKRYQGPPVVSFAKPISKVDRPKIIELAMNKLEEVQRLLAKAQAEEKANGSNPDA